jgi:hypothetical protein
LEVSPQRKNKLVTRIKGTSETLAFSVFAEDIICEV